MTTNELRPCPFCGQKPWLFRTDMVQCANKDCFMHYDDDIDLDDWNTRPIEDGLQAKVVALQKELDELKDLYRWHKIADDGLPEESGEYQVYGLFSENFDPEICSSSYSAGDYYEPPHWNIYSTVVGAVQLQGCDITIEKATPVTHWRKMPDDTPEEGEK